METLISNLGLHCSPVTLLRVSRLQWVNILQAPDQGSCGPDFKLPRTLEDCQRKIIALQASNAELQSRNISDDNGTVRVPEAQYQDMRTRASLMEQTQQQMGESDRLNTHLQQTVQELRQGKVTNV